MTTGGVVSVTVTVKLALAMLPWASCAEQVTNVVPSANVLPDAGAHVGTSGPSTVSVADALKVAIALVGPVASSVWDASTAITGGVVSGCAPTVTWKLACTVLTRLSLVVHVTVVVRPDGNVEPEAGTHATGRAPSTWSSAVGNG